VTVRAPAARPAVLIASAGVPALRLMLEPQQGGTYDEFLSLALAAEAAGFDGVFRSDHLATIGGGPQRDALEAWTTLAALARDTSRLRLGSLVSPVTFRHPAVLARCAVTVDQISRGRCELGMGAGWFELEHRTLGIPFPGIGERFTRFAEAVAVVAALVGSPDPQTLPGVHYALSEAIALPPPVQRPLPLIIGGHGGRGSVRLAARHAHEYNTLVRTPDEVAGVGLALREACDDAQRDPATLLLSWMGPCVVGATQADLHRRAAVHAAAMGDSNPDGRAAAAALATRGIVGLYDEAAERLRALIDAGCERLYLQVLTLDDPEMLLEIADDVAPRAGL